MTIRSVRLVIHVFLHVNISFDKHVLLSISTTYGLQKMEQVEQQVGP